MDSADTETERRLAEVVLRGRAHRVLVGGLGLGYTAAELLAADVGHLDVVELEECLVEWAYAGLTPTLAAVARDPRVALHPADVAEVLTGRRPEAPGPWDAIVLDVDNGPGLPHPRGQRRAVHPVPAGGRVRAGSARAARWRSGPRDPLRTCSPP